MKRKKKIYLNIEESNKILEDILKDCKLELNTVPLDTLLSYSNYRKERYAFQKRTLLFMLGLFILLPFLFLPLNITVENNGNNTYLLTTKKSLPLLSISAKVNDGKQIIATEKKDVYRITPSDNGTLDIVVTQWNLQKKSISIPISGIDNVAPVVKSQKLVDDTLIEFIVQDNESGIDYEHTYAKTSDGTIVHPDQYDESDQTIYFEYGPDYTDFYIVDIAGNTLHLK